MQYKGNEKRIKKILDLVGNKWSTIKKMHIDWSMLYPVVNKGILVGIVPADGLNEIEFEVDERNDIVHESKIQDYRKNVFMSNPYWDFYVD